MLKKTLSLLLFFTLYFALSTPVFAFSTSNEVGSETRSEEYQKISDLYGIPVDILEDLSEDIISSLTEGIDTKELHSSKDTYIKISEKANGDVIISENTLSDYLFEQSKPTLFATDSNSWIRVHTTISETNSTYAEISAAFTWLTRPSFRMRDVIGLSISSGTIVSGSANGFYTYTTSQGSYNTNLTSGFKYQGHGVTREVNLAKPNNPVRSDYMFLRANMIKEGKSTGLNGSYGHQRLSLKFSPGFSISRNGILSAIGINFGMSYDQFKGYQSILWRK